MEPKERKGFYVRIPARMAWLEAEMRAVAEKEGGISKAMRDAFCEFWGKKYPSLKEKHAAAKKLGGQDDK